MEAPLPNAERFAASIAWSRSSIRITLSTGPKTSSRAMVIVSRTLSTIVAPEVEPVGRVGDRTPRPSQTIVAPSFSPLLDKARDPVAVGAVISGPMSGCDRPVGPSRP